MQLGYRFSCAQVQSLDQLNSSLYLDSAGGDSLVRPDMYRHGSEEVDERGLSENSKSHQNRFRC